MVANRFSFFAFGWLALFSFEVSAVDAFPTQLGTYRDSRSSKKRLVCEDVSREKKFESANLVFFGKFLSRTENAQRKVFLDKYRVIKVWKGDIKPDIDFEVEVPPPSDFCFFPRSNRHQGSKAKGGGFVIFAKGTPPFIDCCMTESNDLVLRDAEAMDKLDSKFSKLRNALN